VGFFVLVYGDRLDFMGGEGGYFLFKGVVLVGGHN
jgi:hypothetical protein